MTRGYIRNSKSGRLGFTLVELIVAVTIILIIAAATITTINFSLSRDRVRAASRQLQSFLAGARDRAIYAKEIRGVRLILSNSNPHTAIALQYVGSAERWSDSDANLVSDDTIVITNAAALTSAGLIGVGSPIEIPKNSGIYYTLASKLQSGGEITLSRNTGLFTGSSTPISYAIILKPQLLSGSQPIPLPAGTAIDLDGSKLPSQWRPPTTNSALPYSSTMDVLFNPRGDIIGDAATVGLLHFLIADTVDLESWRSQNNIEHRVQKPSPSLVDTTSPAITFAEWQPPSVPVNLGTDESIVKRDLMVVSLNARTGNAAVHNVSQTALAGTRIAADPFRLAETGEGSN